MAFGTDITASRSAFQQAWPNYRFDRRKAAHLALVVTGGASRCFEDALTTEAMAAYQQMRAEVFAADGDQELINAARLKGRQAYAELYPRG